MESPEKIYLFKNPIDGMPDYRWLSKMSCSDDIEYVRKDVLYKKIEIWLNKRHKHDRYTLIYLRKHFKEIINEIMDD